MIEESRQVRRARERAKAKREAKRFASNPHTSSIKKGINVSMVDSVFTSCMDLMALYNNDEEKGREFLTKALTEMFVNSPNRMKQMEEKGECKVMYHIMNDGTVFESNMQKGIDSGAKIMMVMDDNESTRYNNRTAVLRARPIDRLDEKSKSLIDPMLLEKHKDMPGLIHGIIYFGHNVKEKRVGAKAIQCGFADLRKVA
jgi:hypothetical protein